MTERRRPSRGRGTPRRRAESGVADENPYRVEAVPTDAATPAKRPRGRPRKSAATESAPSEVAVVAPPAAPAPVVETAGPAEGRPPRGRGRGRGRAAEAAGESERGAPVPAATAAVVDVPAAVPSTGGETGAGDGGRDGQGREATDGESRFERRGRFRRRGRGRNRFRDRDDRPGGDERPPRPQHEGRPGREPREREGRQHDGRQHEGRQHDAAPGGGRGPQLTVEGEIAPAGSTRRAATAVSSVGRRRAISRNRPTPSCRGGWCASSSCVAPTS